MVRVSKGLDGVVIDDSTVSMVDGEAGEIWYRGYSIDDLAERSTYPETLALLWDGDLPSEAALDDVTDRLAERRSLPGGVERTIEELAPRAGTMDALRTAVSMLAGYADDPDEVEDVARLREHLLDVAAKTPTIVAQIHRRREGLEPVEPRRDLGHAENFLYALRGEEPPAEHARALEKAFVLYAEHEMNASTFAAVVTASTLSNPYAALTSAIGALQGPLHGGATETVVEMFEEIGDPDEVEDWVDEQIATDGRIPGFGHRVYRVDDPRCAHFRRSIEAIGPEGEMARWFEIAQRLQTAVGERLGEKGIHANTDLYSGIFYRLLDVPPALYTAVFGASRVAGWGAHVLEQLADNRIIRPRVEYVGEVGREYVPVESR